MLAHQLPALPPIETFWQDLQPFFDWLEGHLEVEQIEPSSTITGDVFHVSRFSRYGNMQSVLHQIQFGAANRVCIKLTYSGKERTVEPLSFRIASTGNRLFFGFEREAGHVKAYTISNIQSVAVTNIPYTEQYPVEISATGNISMPPIRRESTGRIHSTGISRRLTHSAAHKIQCPVCNKVFTRKNPSDTALNKHKNSWGGNCTGRRGHRI